MLCMLQLLFHLDAILSANTYTSALNSVSGSTAITHLIVKILLFG